MHSSQDLPRFKELIFEDFSRFILVDNVFEEVVLQSVTKDIMMGKTMASFLTVCFHSCNIFRGGGGIYGQGYKRATLAVCSAFFPSLSLSYVQKRV